MRPSPHVLALSEKETGMGSDNSNSNFPPVGPKRDLEKTTEELVREKDKESDKCRIIPFRKNR
jgi:hypothetical protein